MHKCFLHLHAEIIFTAWLTYVTPTPPARFRRLHYSGLRAEKSPAGVAGLGDMRSVARSVGRAWDHIGIDLAGAFPPLEIAFGYLQQRGSERAFHAPQVREFDGLAVDEKAIAHSIAGRGCFRFVKFNSHFLVRQVGIFRVHDGYSGGGT